MQSDKKTDNNLLRKVLKHLFYLTFPFIGYFVLVAVFWLIYPPEAGIFTTPPSLQFSVLGLLLVAYLIPPFGKETIIPALYLGDSIQTIISDLFHLGLDTSEITGYPVWVIFAGIVIMDFYVSFFITMNFDLLLKIPLIGAWIRWIMRLAKSVITKKPWIEELSSAGLLIFMYIPLQGSGAMTCSVIGRLLGYSSIQTIGLVVMGSTLSTITVIFGFSSVVELWKINPILGIMLAAVIIACILVIAYFWNKFTKKFVKQDEITEL